MSRVEDVFCWLWKNACLTYCVCVCFVCDFLAWVFVFHSMVPSRPDIDAEAARQEIEANQDRIEAAFLKYIHRVDAYDDHEMVEHSHEEEHDDNPHEFEVIVGHGNVIRYFFCRALQLPPEVWLRFSTFNCSISK